MATSETKEIKKQETLVRISIISYKNRCIYLILCIAICIAICMSVDALIEKRSLNLSKQHAPHTPIKCYVKFV